MKQDEVKPLPRHANKVLSSCISVGKSQPECLLVCAHLNWGPFSNVLLTWKMYFKKPNRLQGPGPQFSPCKCCVRTCSLEVWVYFVWLCISHLEGWRCWQRWRGLTWRDRLPENTSSPGKLTRQVLIIWKGSRRLQRWFASHKYSPGTHKRSEAQHDKDKRR